MKLFTDSDVLTELLKRAGFFFLQVVTGSSEPISNTLEYASERPAIADDLFDKAGADLSDHCERQHAFCHPDLRTVASVTQNHVACAS